MSKTSRFFLTVIVVGLAFIAGVRLYRAYESYAAQQAQEEETATHTFNNVPIDYRPSVEQEPVLKQLPQEGEKQEIFLEDAPLPPQQARQQAQETIVSVLNDYRQDPKIQAFYDDLKNATGEDITLAQLSGTDLAHLLQTYPQLQAVIAKHAQDPEFAKTLQEIFTNPQFVQSVAILQNTSNQ